MSRRDGFARIPDWLYRHARPALGLTTADIAVYVVLEGHSNAKGLTSPSYPLIAWEAGISEAWVAKVVRRLMEHGLIKRISEGRQHRSAVYQMLKDPVLPPMPERPLSRAESRRRSQTPTQVESDEIQGRTHLHSGEAQTPTGEALRLQLSTSEVDPEVETSIGAPPQAEDGDQFEQFWDIYPSHRRGTKKAVRIAWDEAPPPADIISRLRAWLPTITNPKYVPNADKWIRERRWSEITVQGPSAEYLAWLKTPEGREHQRRKEADS